MKPLRTAFAGTCARSCAALAGSLGLAACTGGGSSSSPPSPPAQPPALQLFAGSPTEAGTSDGPGLLARFRDVNAIATSGPESIVVSEGRTQLGFGAVRRIATPQAGVTTLMRSSPEALEWLVGVGADLAGNAYIARLGYCGLRCNTGPAQPARVAPTGAETAIPIAAGNLADSSALSTLVTDSAGTVYLGGSERLSRIGAQGQLETVRDYGAFSHVTGIAFDKRGALHAAVVTCVLSCTTRIHRLEPSGQWTELGQVADQGAGLAVDERGDVYVAFAESSVVRKFGVDGVVSTVAGTEGHRGFAAGPLPGLLDRPNGVAIQGTDLYIAMPTFLAVVHRRP